MRSLRWLVPITALLINPDLVPAQAVQAARGVGRAQERAIADTIAVMVGELTGHVAALRAYRTLAFTDGSAATIGRAAGLEQLEQLARQAIDLRDRPEAFARAFASYRAAAATFVTGAENIAFAPEGSEQAKRVQALDRALNQSLVPRVAGMPPALKKYVPDVVFSIGLGYVTAASDTGESAIPLSVTTNLVGQLGGSIVSAIGAGDLGDYFKDNIVAGVALQTRKIGKPSGQLTAGLGETGIGPLTLWPVIGFEQADTADARIPAALRTRHPGVGTWTSPVVATAFTWMQLDSLVQRLGRGRITPIITVGVRFPYHYPGNTVDALGALFGNKLSGYVREGNTQWVLMVDVPLLKVDPQRKKP